ncbi:MAG: CYTH domain-containing protein [Lachnospiraceae bacterium]|nr:CYTH domain-containing protein [Lachnospiraceae bacterium]
MEIEKKFLVDISGLHLEDYPKKELMQGYVLTDPVIRARREDNKYYLTVKGKGLLAREELNLDLSHEAFDSLIKKSDNAIIEKTRYLIPYTYNTATRMSECHATIELDIFKGALQGLIMAEVEFDSTEEAREFVAPSWFKKEITEDSRYQNANMISLNPYEIKALIR